MRTTSVAVLVLSLITQPVLAFDVHNQSIVLVENEEGPPKLVCVTTKFDIKITKTEALTAIGEGNLTAALTMQHWDEDVLSDDLIAAPSATTLDLSVQILAASVLLNGFNNTTYRRRDCVESDDAVSESGEDEIEWYVKIFVAWGDEWDNEWTSVKVVNL